MQNLIKIDPAVSALRVRDKNAVSRGFLPRDEATVARLGNRNSVRPSVCPSVRLSVTRVLCD